jgi:hypothetical protein
MTSAGEIRERVFEVDGLRLEWLHKTGRRVRADRGGFPEYPYRRAARENLTVERWLSLRVRRLYPDFWPRVVDAAGRPVHGSTLVRTVRGSYGG